MALRGALHLHDFLDRLPALAALGVLLRVAAAVEGLRGVHAAIRQVAVVRDRERPAAGALLVGLHPGPELLGVFAVPGRERKHLARASLAVAQQHVAVQVVAARRRRPLEADERGELAGLVVLVGHDGRALPHRHHQRARDLRVGQHRWQCVGRLRADQFGYRRGGLGAARLDHAAPALDGAVAHQRRVAVVDLGDEPETLAVVAQDDEIERPRQARRQARRRDHFFAAGDAVGLLRREAIAGRECVSGIGAVQVGVTPQHACRVLAAGIRRIGLRLGRRLAGGHGDGDSSASSTTPRTGHFGCLGGLRAACLGDDQQARRRQPAPRRLDSTEPRLVICLPLVPAGSRWRDNCRVRAQRAPKRYITPALIMKISVSWNATSESPSPHSTLPTACQRPLSIGSR